MGEEYRGGTSSGGSIDPPCLPGQACTGRITGHNPLVLFGGGALLLILGLIIGYLLGKNAAQASRNR